MSEIKGFSGKEPVAEAIAQVLAGDENAYGIIYKCCDGRLRASVVSHYKHYGPDFVDEVVARTHVWVYSNLNQYDSTRSAFQTWMNWQSRAMAKKVLREWRPTRQQSFDDDAQATLGGVSDDPADAYEVEKNSRTLWEEYGALAEDGRLSIALHDIDRQTFDVTARHLSMDVNKVRRRRNGALAELRRRLKRRGIGVRSCTMPEPPVWSGRSETASDDDWTATVTARLPFVPDDLTGAAEEPEPKGDDT